MSSRQVIAHKIPIIKHLEHKLDIKEQSMSNEEVELKLLDDYFDAVAEAVEGEDSKDSTRKIAIYEKQLGICKSLGLDINIRWYESKVYAFKALQKLQNQGLIEKTLRSTARQAQGFDGIAPALMAKEQERGRAHEAISLINQAINLHDDADLWILKVHLYHTLNDREAALRDVNHVLSKYSNEQEVYLTARKLKDEIEAAPQKRCFIATAAYESSECAELNILRGYRDEVLLESIAGRVFVRVYYTLSPSIASWISRSPRIKLVVRAIVLDPIVALLKRRSKDAKSFDS
jgi:tetratricopeptide (TPR) repeat protein